MYELTINGVRHSTHRDAVSALDTGSELLDEYGENIPLCRHSRPCESAPHRTPCHFCRTYEQVCREWEAWYQRRIAIDAGVTIMVAGLSLAVLPL